MAELVPDPTTIPPGNHDSIVETSLTDALANLTIVDKKEQPRLTTLPSELHLKIFDLLDNDPESSTCLGLTCKKLYPLFFARHPKPKLFRMCPRCEFLKRQAFADKESKNLYKNCGSCEGIDTSKLQLFVLLEKWMAPKWKFSAYGTKFLTSRAAAAIQRCVCDNFGINEPCSARSLMKFDGYGCSSCTASLENTFLGAVWLMIYDHRPGRANPGGLEYGGMSSKGRRGHHGQSPTNTRTDRSQYQFTSGLHWGARGLYK